MPGGMRGKPKIEYINAATAVAPVQSNNNDHRQGPNEHGNNGK
jgi:hypothetical protein